MEKKNNLNTTNSFMLKSMSKEAQDYIHLRNFQKNSPLGKKIDEIFDTTDDLNEIESKISLLVSKEMSKIQEKQGSSAEKTDLSKDITKLIKDVIEERDSDTTNLDTVIKADGREKKNKYSRLKEESKKHLKAILKNFAIYEIYKVMNPRRIAGETAKINYMNNMAVGGEKLASKHTGGRPRDLAKYSAKDLQAANKLANTFKKPEGWVLKK
jgi:hypothetical protein